MIVGRRRWKWLQKTVRCWKLGKFKSSRKNKLIQTVSILISMTKWAIIVLKANNVRPKISHKKLKCPICVLNSKSSSLSAMMIIINLLTISLKMFRLVSTTTKTVAVMKFFWLLLPNAKLPAWRLLKREGR